jgi:hypothetical protein
VSDFGNENLKAVILASEAGHIWRRNPGNTEAISFFNDYFTRRLIYATLFYVD